METIHNTSTTPNTSSIRVYVRSILVLAGILTAIICSLIFLQEIDSSSAESMPKTAETSKFVTDGVLMKFTNIAAASAMSILK